MDNEDVTIEKVYKAKDGAPFTTNHEAKVHNCQEANRTLIMDLVGLDAARVVITNAELITTALKCFLPAKVRVKK